MESCRRTTNDYFNRAETYSRAQTVYEGAEIERLFVVVQIRLLHDVLIISEDEKWEKEKR